ncbi:MAG: hypothetical protein RIT15_1597 [Pseudomonadota bacterium]|jgi:uncharacterized membrane protein
MNQRTFIATTAAALLTGLLATQMASAQAPAKEKCFGIAAAGQNDCANLSGSHSCAGQSKVAMGADEWKYVAKGECKNMKGMSMDEAKMKMKKM